MPCRCAILVVLQILSGCGGGGGDAPVLVAPTSFRVGGGGVVLTLDGQGRLTDARAAGDGRNLAASEPQPVVELVVAGQALKTHAARQDGSDMVVSFDGGNASVRFAIEEGAGRLIFRVVEVLPPDAEVVRLRLAFRRLEEIDPALNGTYDEDTIVCLRSITPATRSLYRTLPGVVPQLGVEWDAAHGIVGGAAALIATTRSGFFAAVNDMEAAEGLPSPRFDSTAARASRTARQSYLFLTFYRSGDAAKIIEYAKSAGMGSVLLLRGLWRQSSGTYGLDPTRWPGGLAEFQGFCDQLHAAGLGVGLHFYGPSISLNDPLVTPVPDDGLLAWDCPALAAAVSSDDATLVLESAPALPAAGGGGFPGSYLRIGNEIVRYTGTQTAPSFAFTGCERGALGTTAAAHAQGATPSHLATVYDLLLLDPEGPLVETVASNLARVVNGARIDMVYFDGIDQIPNSRFVQGWYYMNRILPAMYAAFDHPVLVQTSLGPGRELDWHIVPRSASADGHGDIKWYLDQRRPTIESIRRGLTVPDIGWYGFDAGRPLDHLEYVCAKALGWDCGISLQTHVIELDNDRRAGETLQMVARYERWKQSGGPPDEIRDALLVEGQEFRLLEDDLDAPQLFRASFDAPRDIRSLTAGAYTWSVGNANAEDRTLGIEISRGEAIRTHADFGAPGVTTIDRLVVAAPYTPSAANDSARLMNRTDKVVTSAGAARDGVQHGLAVVPDAAVGGQALELTATNTNTRIGWCAAGRVFDPVLDLSGQAATGLWVRGDGSGIELSIDLYDEMDRRVVVKVPMFFAGWRFHTFPFAVPAAFDASKVKYLTFTLADLPPEATVSARLALLRATSTVRAPSAMTGAVIEIGGRLISLPDALPPGGTARIDALGRLTVWSGGMDAGQTTNLVGGPITVPSGVSQIIFRATGPTPFPGDVVVRTSRLVRIYPE